MKTSTPLLCLLGGLTLSGCSVMLALDGKRDPDMMAVQLGASRGEIELELGPPVRSGTFAGKSVEIYQYRSGNNPSVNRALFHGVMDVATLGYWEILAAPVEFAAGGAAFELAIAYDKEGKVEVLEFVEKGMTDLKEESSSTAGMQDGQTSPQLLQDPGAVLNADRNHGQESVQTLSTRTDPQNSTRADPQKVDVFKAEQNSSQTEEWEREAVQSAGPRRRHSRPQ
ncbi:MAG: hypothetical protein HQL82_06040 [Magnetococcales bacterium]|nr:hypothetical protein [Magnetococcales bacterium]